MDVIVGFRNTFNYLLSDSGKSMATIGRESGISPYVIMKWKKQSVDPKAKTLIKLADYFNCSIEYLCGKTNDYLDYKPQSCPAFGERLVEVLKASGWSSYKLFKQTKISPAQYHRWRKGMEPLLSSLEAIAEALDVTLDYLVGRNR